MILRIATSWSLLGVTLMVNRSLVLAMMMMHSCWMMCTWVLWVWMPLMASLMRPKMTSQWVLPSLPFWQPWGGAPSGSGYCWMVPPCLPHLALCPCVST